MKFVDIKRDNQMKVFKPILGFNLDSEELVKCLHAKEDCNGKLIFCHSKNDFDLDNPYKNPEGRSNPYFSYFDSKRDALKFLQDHYEKETALKKTSFELYGKRKTLILVVNLINKQKRDLILYDYIELKRQ